VESEVLLPTEEMRQWVSNLWRAAGSAEQEAQLTADHLIGANLAGHDSHGVGMVAPYVRSLQAGELQLNQRISIVTDAESLLVVDGNRGIGQSMAFQTMQLAVERARRNGVVIVGLRNTHHIGRVGHWAEQAIAAGFASIHFTNVVSRPIVAPHGGRQSRFGTNPLTVGLPRRNAPPILLDFASSAIAVGKVRVAYNRKGQAPAGVLIDNEGNPTEVLGLIAAGMIKPPYMIQFVFGVPGGMHPDARLLPILIDRLPPRSEWSISCQTGDPETYVRFMMQAFVENGHVRTGMEDYVYLRPGELATSNAAMVEQWVDTARIWGRPVASPADARALLGIASGA